MTVKEIPAIRGLWKREINSPSGCKQRLGVTAAIGAGAEALQVCYMQRS